ncbi:MAG: hypothetical protein V4519_02175 [Patescibacteria group bacterium]
MLRSIALFGILLAFMPSQLMAADATTKPAEQANLQELKAQFLKERAAGNTDLLKQSENESRTVGVLLKDVERFPNLSADEGLSIIFNRDRLEKCATLRTVARRLMAKNANEPANKEDTVTLEAVISQLRLEMMKQIEFQAWYLKRSLDELSAKLATPAN